jgi:DNA-binding FadR family transcriptional regulator
VFHFQTINSLHQRFERFMAPFRGPATKNLTNYTAWFIACSTRDYERAATAAWDHILAA